MADSDKTPKPLNQFTLDEAFRLAKAHGYSGHVLLLADVDGTVVKTWSIDEYDLWINDIEFIADLRGLLPQGDGPDRTEENPDDEEQGGALVCPQCGGVAIFVNTELGVAFCQSTGCNYSGDPVLFEP